MGRVIMHIDMNSYFATVEQQANPRLRGRPVAVLGSKAKRTIIVASSIEAKRYGVKTGHTLPEAIEICPELTVVHGEPRKYSHVTKKFIEIFERYTDRVEIFSIDEAFLDVTQTEHLYGGAEGIAKKIKKSIRGEIGGWISCSCGIGPNKFLAKLGSDMEKPDGLVVIDEKNKDEVLLATPLPDMCGIGARIHARLESMEIGNTEDLRRCSPLELKREFGLVTGRKLQMMALGLDSSPVVSWREQKPAKSFSCSRTLNRDVTNISEIKTQILFLFEKVAKDMRDDGYWAREIGLWLRFKDFSGKGKTMRIGRWNCDGLFFYHQVLKVLADMNIRSPVRAIGVYAGSVQLTRNVTRSLLDEDQTDEKVLSTMDKVNNRYGVNVVKRASLSGSKLKQVVSGMGRKKF